MTGPYSREWKLGYDNKFYFLDINNTWKLVSRSRNQIVLGDKWVFQTKQNSNVQVTRYKTWWVVEEFCQQYRVHFDETYASVIKWNFYKVFLAIATFFRRPVNQINFITAFFNRAIGDHIVYVEQRLEYEIGINLVCQLQKALYGLKFSPCIQYQLLHNFLISEKFVYTKADHGIFVFLAERLILRVYFDDMLVIKSTQKEIVEIKCALTGKFKMRNLGPVSWYLCLKITRNLLSANGWLSDIRHDGNPIWYCFVVSIVSQFASNPTSKHIAAVKQIFWYLWKYLNLGIIFSQDRIFKLEKHCRLWLGYRSKYPSINN